MKRKQKEVKEKRMNKEFLRQRKYTVGSEKEAEGG